MNNQEIDFKTLFNTEESKPDSENNEPEIKPDKEPEKEPPKKKSKYAVYLIAILLALAIIAAFLVFIMNDEKKDYCVIYNKYNDVYIYRTDTRKTVKLDINKDIGRYLFCYGFSASDPQKFVYAAVKTSDSLNLYYSFFDKYSESFREPVLVAETIFGNINEITVFRNGILFYLTANEYSLYLYDGSEPKKIADNVINFRVNEKADRVVYLDKENNLYQVRINGSAEMIENHIDKFVCDIELNHTYFTKENTLYDKPFNKDKREIAKGEITLDEKYFTEDGLYYTVVPEDKMSYYDFVNDPDPSDKSVEDIREKLKSTNFYINIYFYNGEKSDLIAEHVNYFSSLNSYYNSKTRYAYYYYEINKDESKKYSINDILISTDGISVLKKTDTGEKLYQEFDKKYHVLSNKNDYSLDSNIPVIVSPDEKYVYYLKYQFSPDTEPIIEFYQAELSSSTEKLIDTNIDFSFFYPTENGKIYYSKNYKDLYVDGELLISDIGRISNSDVLAVDDYLVILGITNNNLDKLAFIKDNEMNMINEKVIKFPYFCEDCIFFLEASDKNSQIGTLKLYNDDFIYDIDTDVSSIYKAIPLP